MTSLATDSDVIDTPGLGALPGVVGVVAATAALALVLGAGLRVPHPSFFTALWAAIGCFAAYVGGVWMGAIGQGEDVALATSVAGRLATGWPAPIVAIAGFVSAWSAVAVTRTGARPRWRWERDDGDD